MVLDADQRAPRVDLVVKLSLSGVDVTMDAAGDAFLVGSFNQSLEIDGTVLTTMTYAPDIFVTKLEGGTGRALWSRSNPHASTIDLSPRLRVDGAGNVLLVSLVPPGWAFRLMKFDRKRIERQPHPITPIWGIDNQ